MPDIHRIQIERKLNQKLEPHGDFRQRIRPNAAVRFEVAPPLKGLVIRFKDRSPFVAKTLHYGEQHPIVATFDEQNAANNVYQFDCEEPDAAGGPSINGGEIEILPSLAG